MIAFENYFLKNYFHNVGHSNYVLRKYKNERVLKKYKNKHKEMEYISSIKRNINLIIKNTNGKG